MKALVVYDSLYGNTKIIAQAIGAALPGEVEVQHVDDVNVSELATYDLLIVGAPTHGGRPSDAVKAWLKQVQAPALEGIDVSGFDTRHTHWLTRIFGYAAPRIAKALKKSGGTLVGPPGDFYVTGTEGPLKEGEGERAADWAKALVGSQTTGGRSQ